MADGSSKGQEALASAPPMTEGALSGGASAAPGEGAPMMAPPTYDETMKQPAPLNQGPPGGGFYPPPLPPQQQLPMPPPQQPLVQQQVDIIRISSLIRT